MGNQGSTIRSDVMDELENETAFTAEEIRDYYKGFLKRCPEHRMSMDKATFAQYYTEVFPKNDAHSFADYIFRAFDLDSNSRIDFREFIFALSIHRKGTVEEKLKWLFNLVDIDENGGISHSELKGLVTSLNHLQKKATSVTAEQLADEILMKADNNQDGKLCMDEFIKAAVNVKEMERLLTGTVLAVATPLQKATEQDNK